nr:immunoglobulin heavy chain junction region [Macaca mulatta]MOX59032.1 immunoglobulin heavy chain junction region [Macaca mulatta]MOX59050.1 immunoglobulin heavy chain junction region [Macaca mulatta]MOX59059.1 immunoglobulin heavy chain junction region [Macaca mulatta]MOX59348.1 immunoglobulin heavy chain junction region [Macaca mulatta]
CVTVGPYHYFDFW